MGFRLPALVLTLATTGAVSLAVEVALPFGPELSGGDIAQGSAFLTCGHASGPSTMCVGQATKTEFCLDRSRTTPV